MCVHCCIGAVKQLLSELEAKLGRVFVRSALGYVTASGDGLTEMELLDVLSTDTEVSHSLTKPLNIATYVLL